MISRCLTVHMNMSMSITHTHASHSYLFPTLPYLLPRPTKHQTTQHPHSIKNNPRVFEEEEKKKRSENAGNPATETEPLQHARTPIIHHNNHHQHQQRLHIRRHTGSGYRRGRRQRRRTATHDAMSLRDTTMESADFLEAPGKESVPSLPEYFQQDLLGKIVALLFVLLRLLFEAREASTAHHASATNDTKTVDV